MRQEKKYLADILPQYKRMEKELADYWFYYMVHIWRSRYTTEGCLSLMQSLCVISRCSKSAVMNLVVRMQVTPEQYKHDVRHAAFLMYAMDVPVDTITWLLHIKPVIIRAWVKNQLSEYPDIKRLFTDEETSEIMKLLSTWNYLKGVPI